MIARRSMLFALSLTVAVSASSAFAASMKSVMAIGDSLTNGYTYTNTGAATSSGGWIDLLRTGDLNFDPNAVYDFNFVGSQGSSPNNHEGYDGYTISSTEQGGNPGNITDLIAANGGPINPDTAGADVLMLLLGTNGPRDGTAGATAVQNLDALIATLVNNYSFETLLVSTLAPVKHERGRFGGDTFNTADNASIDEFNQNLLDAFTGTGIGNGDGAWDTGVGKSGTYAEHKTYNGVFLLDLNSAFGPTPGESEEIFLWDNLHLTTLGNQVVADFYTDRFFELGIQQVPTPSAAAIGIVLLLGTGLTRRRRAA